MIYVDFLRFAEVFGLLVDDGNRDNGNKMIFSLLDFKNKGELDIIVLIQILNNIDRNTLFAQELLVLIREHKRKNVMAAGGVRRELQMN